MASRDICSICGRRIGLSEASMQNDMTHRLAHEVCVKAQGLESRDRPREVTLPQRPKPADVTISFDALEPVRTFAKEQHGSQKYGNGLAYSYHLQKVEDVLRRFGANITDDYELLQAAWLHDVVEDCHIPFLMLVHAFGATTAQLVWAVTNEPGVNRAERHRKTYPKIRKIKDAIRLKLADRIANVEESVKEAVAGKVGHLRMYKSEYADFKAALYVQGSPEEEMWKRLDELLEKE